LGKVDGELTRRNRLRTEILHKFEELEKLVEKHQLRVQFLDSKQGLVLNTIAKLVYVQDIQTSLNIQDELDREWVSLFGRLDERTGTRKVIPDETGEQSGASKFTLNRQCMSCNDNMATFVNLFKVACINYQPNPVHY